MRKFLILDELTNIKRYSTLEELSMKEVSDSPSAIENFGTIFSKSTDHKLYFLNSLGVEHEIATSTNGIVDSALKLYDGTHAATVVEVRAHIDDTNNPHEVNAGQVATDTTGFGGILSSADTVVQAALGTIDSHNHDSIYLGITAKAADSDKLDGHEASYFSISTHTHAFASLTSKPTTISGYGITDAYTKSECDNDFMNISDYNKVQNFNPLEQLHFHVDWQSFDNDVWTQYTGGSSTITRGLLNLTLKTGTTTGSECRLYTGTLPNFCINLAKKANLYMRIQNSGTSQTNSTFLAGLWNYNVSIPPSLTDIHVGWKIINGAIWATVADGTTETAVNTGIAFDTTWKIRDLKIIPTSSAIEFYVDDVLKASIDTNIPTWTNSILYFSLKNNDATNYGYKIEHIFGLYN